MIKDKYKEKDKDNDKDKYTHKNTKYTMLTRSRREILILAKRRSSKNCWIFGTSFTETDISKMQKSYIVPRHGKSKPTDRATSSPAKYSRGSGRPLKLKSKQAPALSPLM